MLAAAWIGLAVLVRLATTAGNAQHAGWHLLVELAGLWLAFTVAVVAIRRVPARRAVPILVVGGVALQLVAMASPPQLTDDFYRYAWDGRVQAAGISPYRYPPTDPALAALRTPWLFPPGCTRISTAGTSATGTVTACTRLNHPDSPTIYPPVAQAEFFVVHEVTRPLGPDGGGARTWQLLAALLATATTLVLVRILRRHGDPRQALLWAWCPTVVLECGGNAHVDALSSLLVVLALAESALAASAIATSPIAQSSVATVRAGGVRRRIVAAGVLAGAGIATKLLPVLVLPAMLAPVPGPRSGRVAWAGWLRGRGVLLLAAAGAVALAYLPHVLAAGSAVLGFLPGYVPEEGYDGSSRFPLLRLWLPHAATPAVGFALIAGTAFLVARRTDPRRPWTGAMVLVGVTFAVLGITYPWYALLLVPLVALDGRGRWLGLAAAGYPGYLADANGLAFTPTVAAGYALALLAAGAGEIVTRRRAGRPGSAIASNPATPTGSATPAGPATPPGPEQSPPSCSAGSCSCASPAPHPAARTGG